MDYINPFKAMQETATAVDTLQTQMGAKTDLAAAMKEAGPGAQSPEDLINIYNKVAASRAKVGDAVGAFTFGEKAAAQSENLYKQQSNQIKATQEKLALAGPLVDGATNSQELVGALKQAGVSDQYILQLVGQLRNLPFDQQKAALKKMGMSMQQQLTAKQLELDERFRGEELAVKQKYLKLETSKQAYLQGFDIEADKGIKELLGGDAGKTTPSGAKATTEGAGSWLEQRASTVETKGAKDPYTQVNPLSGATGKYQFVKSTWDALRKEDPNLPSFERLSGDKDAQEKGAKMLEARISDEIKNAGLPVTNANKDLWWRFGDTDAQKLLNAKEDAPVEKILSADIIKKNPDLKGKTVGEAIASNVSKEVSGEEAQQQRTLTEMYDKKRGGGLAPKEWDTISPTQVQIGKEYKLRPQALTNATTDEKKQANTSYQVTKLAEETADYVKEHPKAAGTLATLIKKTNGMSGNILDNIAKDKSYTGEVAELGKRLFALGLKDAGTSGRLNVYLEKQFADFYQQSQSPETLVRILKARQDESFNVLRDTYGADRDNLDKSKYKLATSESAKDFLGEEPPSATKSSRLGTAPGFGGRSSGAQVADKGKSEAEKAGF